MPTKKSATTRAKDFLLAIHRIERGRSHSGATKVNFTTVANEVGVSAALIHNHYPAIADKIRTLQGKSHQQQRDKAREALRSAKDECQRLRDENKQLDCKIRQLASINARLEAEIAGLQTAANLKVLPLRKR